MVKLFHELLRKIKLRIFQDEREISYQDSCKHPRPWAAKRVSEMKRDALRLRRLQNLLEKIDGAWP